MNETFEKPGGGSFWITVLLAVAGFLIFSALMFFWYLPTRHLSTGPVANLSAEERVQRNILTPEERKARLADLHAHDRAALSRYEWIDKEKGLVRLPINRAVELTAQELQKKPAAH